MFLDNRGQAMASYRLLIGAIMGLMILVIIVSAISYLQQLEEDISAERVQKGLRMAVKQPTGAILTVKDAILKPGMFTRKMMSVQMNLPQECIEIQAKDVSALTLTDNAVQINQRYKTNVYIKCNVNYIPGCDIGCLVSFAERIE